MNIHKSSGISKKIFKKHNSIENTKVTIEDIDDEKKTKDSIKRPKISGIRRHGIHIINNARRARKNKSEFNNTKKTSTYSKKIPENKVIFDEKENVEEDSDIFFDTEGTNKEEIISESSEFKDVNIQDAENTSETNTQKEEQILKNIESFEKKEKDLNATTIKPIKNEKKEKNLNIDDIDDVKKNNVSNTTETVDEDGLIIKESSRNSGKKNNINTTDEEETSQKHSKSLLLVIIAITLLIVILIGGFIFYKKIKENKLNQVNKIKIEKETSENDKKNNSTNKEDDTKKTTEHGEVKKVSVRNLFSNCDYFSNNLSSCTPYSCKFEHPETHEILQRKINGIKDGKCNYSETLPDKKVLKCNYDEVSRKKVSDFYKKIIDAKFIGQTEPNKDTINGIENPIKTMLADNICTIEENTEVLVTKDCPKGKDYKGEYNNNNKLMPLCIDSTLKCEQSCPNCKSDKQTLVLDRINGSAKCEECTKSSECKDGFHCFNNSCVTNDVLLNELDCSVENDNCKKLPCKDCSEGNKYCIKGKKDWQEELKNKCVDCTDTKYCKEGFRCENYKCVK